jgi:DNA-binding NarL/FixJ family response regulator
VAELQQCSLQVVGTAVDGLEAVEKARVLQPNLIIMDVWMPRLNGVAATGVMATVAPASSILIVSNERAAVVVRAALAAGARGYLLKSRAGDELLNAVETIVRGDRFIGHGLPE